MDLELELNKFHFLLCTRLVLFVLFTNIKFLEKLHKKVLLKNLPPKKILRKKISPLVDQSYQLNFTIKHLAPRHRCITIEWTVFLCILNVLCCWYCLLQISHIKGRFWVWTKLCLWRLEYSVNRRPQVLTVQTYGFSPECMRTWFL